MIEFIKEHYILSALAVAFVIHQYASRKQDEVEYDDDDD